MRKHFSQTSRLALLLTSAAILVAQSDHITPFTGTWKLNVAKSKFDPGPGPKSLTVTYAPDGSFTREFVGADGKSGKLSYPWSGGTEVPIEGAQGVTILSNYHGNTVDHTIKQGGKTMTAVHAVVSPDGKTVTATIDDTDSQGHPGHNVQVFDKR